MTISGSRTPALQILVDGVPLRPQRSQRVWNHSPDGFECGYAGSGPAQLALALLLQAGADDATAISLHQRFKAAYVQHWHPPFVVDVDIAAWIAAQPAGDRARPTPS
jgi:hypothetical protein